MVKNPGTMLNLNEKCAGVYPVVFDGIRIYIHRGLSSHFRVTHNIFLSSITPGNYRFGATYIGNKIVKEHEGYPVLLGDIDSMGNMNASLCNLFGSSLKVRLDSQMENGSFINSQLAAHYFGSSFTASAIICDPDILKKSGSLLLQYLQNITPRVAIGTEFALMKNMYSYQTASKTPSMLSQLSLMGRYSTPLTTWSAAVSLGNILVNCYQKASDQIEFGLEINSNLRLYRSVGTLAFQVRLPDRGVVFRGSLDSDSNVGSVYQRNICNTPFAVSVSCNMNHITGNFRLGLGFIVE